jgi:DNA-binding LacI/PurR family transcriptional regulator
MKETSKYRKIFEQLQQELRDGHYPYGVPLPSDEALVRRFDVSRITAVKAMDELVKRGLVYRRRGAGTFATPAARLESGRLGLIMPSLSFGEIFPSICQSLTRCAQEDGYTFLLGDISAATPKERAHQACAVARSFVEQHVAGVVLQPLAFLRKPERVTQEILSLFDSAEIPVVLIDRDIDITAKDVRHDFVGIDNVAAGRALGAHVLEAGAKRVHFLMRPNCATVIRDRLIGVQSALAEKSLLVKVVDADPSNVSALRPLFKKRSHPDAVICESDQVAALLNNTLLRFGLRVPKDVMLAGFDDVHYAMTMVPPLTTVHQPCANIAKIAYRTLRERMGNADLPRRRILLPAPLVVRESTQR